MLHPVRTKNFDVFLPGLSGLYCRIRTPLFEFLNEISGLETPVEEIVWLDNFCPFNYWARSLVQTKGRESNWPSILTLRPPITPDSLVSTRISLVTLIFPFSKAAPEHLILLSCCLVNSSPPVILPANETEINLVCQDTLKTINDYQSAINDLHLNGDPVISLSS